jgi:hypothetical protein
VIHASWHEAYLSRPTLFPEARNRAPSDNDEVFHYLFIERANQALAEGDNS